MAKTFIEHMGSDFAEMLTARGFTYEGPIPTYDELVYAQKKNDDMILEVEMNWTLMASGKLSSLRWAGFLIVNQYISITMMAM